MIQHYINLIRI